MKLVTLFLLIVYSNVVNGQMYSLSDKVYNDILKLKTTKQDTIIRFDLPFPHDIHKDSLQGIGYMEIYDVAYLIVKRSSDFYSLKYVYRCDEDCMDRIISISKPLQIQSDSIFYILRSSLNSIRKEEIYPYIYQIKVNNNFHYDMYTTHHSGSYGLWVYTMEEETGKTIGTDWVEKKRGNIPENLNYNNNVKTSLYALYKTILNYVDKNDKLYRFDR